LHGVQGVGGSSPLTPTNKIKDLASKGAKSFSVSGVSRKFSHTFSHTALIAGHQLIQHSEPVEVRWSPWCQQVSRRCAGSTGVGLAPAFDYSCSKGKYSEPLSACRDQSEPSRLLPNPCPPGVDTRLGVGGHQFCDSHETVWRKKSSGSGLGL
jgi:hypothetical protein